jgi:hypothetical protein
MQPQLEIQGLSIVLRGHFNPAIFHPSWFAAQNLIRNQEAEAADIELVHPNAAIFKAEWLQVRVLQDRLQVITTQEPYYEALRDLVIGVFDLLGHTPLRVMGINRDFHYRLESEKVWDAVGNRLAPKQNWENILGKPGMLSLTMEGKRPDNQDGYIRVTVEPSPQVAFGVYVRVNDHYQLSSDSETLPGTSKAVDILTGQWSESMQRGLEIAQKIVSLEQ